MSWQFTSSRPMLIARLILKNHHKAKAIWPFFGAQETTSNTQAKHLLAGVEGLTIERKKSFEPGCEPQEVLVLPRRADELNAERQAL